MLTAADAGSAIAQVAQEERGTAAAVVAQEAAATQANVSSQGTGSSEPGRAWKGEVEAGFIGAFGNSRSQSLRGRMKLQYKQGLWSNDLNADLVRMQENGTTTTEQFTVAAQSRRALSERSYWYLGARYETDRIAGYSPRISESTGPGRTWLFGDRLQLSAEAGVGGSQTWTTENTRQNEAILRLAGKMMWKFAATSEFTEDAFSEFGEHNVYSESSTSLKMRMNESFSLKFNVTVKHNTVVPPGKDKTDTISSMTLVYNL
jgi:putative salt-induced outer membrane protein